MPNYMLIESRDPFESPDTSFLADTAVSLKKRGNNVTVFLMQNGVLAARKRSRKSHVSQLLESGVTVMADDLSLTERGIQAEECQSAMKIASIEQLVDLLIQENTRAVWH